MTVNLDLTPEQEAEVSQQAQESGLAPDNYLQGLLQQTITAYRRTAEAAPLRPKFDREAMLNLLDELETNHEKYGTPEEQRETLEYLKTAIDADRPGQRRIFGGGYNPA